MQASAQGAKVGRRENGGQTENGGRAESVWYNQAAGGRGQEASGQCWASVQRQGPGVGEPSARRSVLSLTCSLLSP